MRDVPAAPGSDQAGFVQFVEQRKKSGAGLRLFPDLKPGAYR
jgi:hypothetical protein